MLPIALLSKKKPHFQAAIGAGLPSPLRGGFATFHVHLDPMEGPLDLLPRIQQSYWTSMRATRWVIRLGKF
jgi:hypothetical protein